MPYEIAIQAAKGFILVTGSGEANLESSLASIVDLNALQAEHTHWPVLADLRALEYVPSLDDSRAFMVHPAGAKMFRDHPMAILVDSMLQYGVARMLATMIGVDGGVAHAFRDLDAAEEWLAQVPRPPRRH